MSFQGVHELPNVVCKMLFDHFSKRGYQASVQFPEGSLAAQKV